ncbi:MAG: AzlC family ABC transporter permease [Massiliimalia sp.]|jgi:4-azaleucine resistance transporter AzlC
MNEILPEHPARAAFRAALPHTLPICAGFLFLGTAYGVYMNAAGFSFWWPLLMSLTIFAGSMEFVTVNLLLQAFDPVHAFFMALMVNARHLFYGISMLEKFRNMGKFKPYLIFGMCDESFSIHCSAKVPNGVDERWFAFFVTLLNQCYWVAGAALGGIFGGFIPFDTTGIDFVMTALFVVIFVEQWISQKQHLPALTGLIATAVCLVLFGAEQFLLPAMALILAVLTLFRRRLDPEYDKEKRCRL